MPILIFVLWGLGLGVPYFGMVLAIENDHYCSKCDVREYKDMSEYFDHRMETGE